MKEGTMKTIFVISFSILRAVSLAILKKACEAGSLSPLSLCRTLQKGLKGMKFPFFFLETEFHYIA